MAISSQVCVITEVAAKALAAELDVLDHPPTDLGEMYEQMANVFLSLADQVRLKQDRVPFDPR